MAQPTSDALLRGDIVLPPPLARADSSISGGSPMSNGGSRTRRREQAFVIGVAGGVRSTIGRTADSHLGTRNHPRRAPRTRPTARRRHATPAPPRTRARPPGGTASGKTTVCSKIMHRLHDSCAVLVHQVRRAQAQARACTRPPSCHATPCHAAHGAHLAPRRSPPCTAPRPPCHALPGPPPGGARLRPPRTASTGRSRPRSGQTCRTTTLTTPARLTTRRCWNACCG